jgi:acetylornithine/N-succinyldiaminopimelate aminotransferase
MATQTQSSSPQSQRAQSHLLPSFARADLVFERGEGAWLVSDRGDRYLDFGSGIAVNSLGHAHPELVEALTRQAQKLWHVSNAVRIPEGEAFADRLCEVTFADRVFFCNSGAEALEGAIKTARKYQSSNGHEERYRIITFEGAFHGRTLATIAAGGQKKYLEGFGPVSPGFDQVPFGDMKAVEAAIGPETAGILIEPVQGEGGVRPVPAQDLRFLRELSDRHGLVLIFDEVQCGVGRTGKLFAHEWANVTPDIMAIAKGIGGGFPVGAFLTTEEVGKVMVAGTHGSTFGGNPLAMAVGSKALAIISEPAFLENVRDVALLMKQRLAGLKDQYPDVIAEVRGEGLLIGIKAQVGVSNTELAEAARAEKLITIPAGDNVVRLLPPLIIGEAEVRTALEKLGAACAAISGKLKEAARTAAE